MSKIVNDGTVLLRAAERFDYDPANGMLTWKMKISATPVDMAWNERYAGKPAGSLDDDGYIRLVVEGKRLAAHHVCWTIFYRSSPIVEIDHRNRRKSENWINNLRDGDHALNMRNRVGYAASGAKGVYPCGNRWRARIIISGDDIEHLGIFDTVEEASVVYQRAHEVRQ